MTRKYRVMRRQTFYGGDVLTYYTVEKRMFAIWWVVGRYTLSSQACAAKRLLEESKVDRVTEVRCNEKNI